MNLIKKQLAGATLVALCVAVAIPSLAAAQEIDPTTSQYGDELTQIETGTNICVEDGSSTGTGTGTGGGGTGVDTDGDGVIDTCVEPTPPSTTISTGGPGDPGDPGTASGLSSPVGPLPFTGFDVIAMAAVALAVAGLGLALQRAVSREPGDGLS